MNGSITIADNKPRGTIFYVSVPPASSGLQGRQDGGDTKGDYGTKEELGRYEADILHLLASEPGRVFSRNAILDAIWGVKAFLPNRTIINYIVKLRQKIEIDPKNPRYLISIYGKGYKFKCT